MKESFSKTIFIILVSILLILAIYIYVFKQADQSVATSKLKGNKTETFTSNILRIGIIEFDNINPILSNNRNIQDISRLIFDPLFTLTQDYKLEGVLAKEWSKITDKTYIIKLNNNIVWHDGNKFDSVDVIFTINTLKKLKEKSIYYHNVKDIELVQEIDEYTIKITTQKEIPYFEYNLIFPIISSKYFNAENLKLESKNIKPVGTGRFYISAANNESVLLKSSSAEKTITLKKYNSLAETIEAFKNGEIDIFTTSNSNTEEYLKNTNYNIKQYINREYNYLALNCNNKILANKEVRQAINYAIDKEEISKNIFNDKCSISNFPLNFGSFSYDLSNDIITCDRNKAKNLLIENGWKYSEQGWQKDESKIKLDIVVNKKNLDNLKVANNIKEQLAKVGILINVKEVEDTEYNNYLKNKNYDLIIVNSTYGYSPSLEKYFGQDNLSNYYNKEINTLLKEADLLTDEKEIKQKYSRITEIYNEEVPYISLYYNTNWIIYSRNLKGSIAPNSYNLFYGIENWYREYEK